MEKFGGNKMKLNELKKLIDFYVGRNKDNQDKEVVIELDQVSVGFSASSQVKQFYEGIDWDSGKFFISTKDKLIMKNKDRDIPVEIKKDPMFKNRYVCTACGYYVCKDDNYCRTCGNKLKTE